MFIDFVFLLMGSLIADRQNTVCLFVCFCLFSQCRVKQKSLSGFHVVGSSMKNNQFDW